MALVAASLLAAAGAWLLAAVGASTLVSWFGWFALLMLNEFLVLCYVELEVAKSETGLARQIHFDEGDRFRLELSARKHSRDGENFLVGVGRGTKYL